MTVPASLAVMQPVRTLAKAKQYCNYSGWHSFKIDSHTSAQPKTKCKSGKTSKQYYSKYKKKWPKKSKYKGKKGSKGWNPYGWNSSNVSYGNTFFSGTQVPSYQISNYQGTPVTLTQSTTFYQLFGSGDGATLLQCLQSGSSTEGAFVTALFNALQMPGYPFTPAQIYSIWQNPGSLGAGLTQAQAALFFQQLNTGA